jgi:hypothetical protein
LTTQAEFDSGSFRHWISGIRRRKDKLGEFLFEPFHLGGTVGRADPFYQLMNALPSHGIVLYRRLCGGFAWHPP